MGNSFAVTTPNFSAGGNFAKASFADASFAKASFDIDPPTGFGGLTLVVGAGGFTFTSTTDDLVFAGPAFNGTTPGTYIFGEGEYRQTSGIENFTISAITNAGGLLAINPGQYIVANTAATGFTAALDLKTLIFPPGAGMLTSNNTELANAFSGCDDLETIAFPVGYATESSMTVAPTTFWPVDASPLTVIFRDNILSGKAALLTGIPDGSTIQVPDKNHPTWVDSLVVAASAGSKIV